MLKRIKIQPINTFVQSQPSTPKTSNTYLTRFENLKVKNVKNSNKADYLYRKGSHKTQAQYIKNWIKSDTDQSQTQQNSGENIIGIDSIKYFKKPNKNKQTQNLSCILSNKKTQNLQLSPTKSDILPSTIHHLKQFIDYCLENGVKKTKMSEFYAAEMQNQPVSQVKRLLQQAHQNLKVQKLKKQAKQQMQQQILKEHIMQIEKIQKENSQFQYQTLMLINSHTQYRDMLRNIFQIQIKIKTAEQQNQQKFESIKQQIKQIIDSLKTNSQKLTESIQIYNGQLNTINQLKINVKQLEQKIDVSKKVGQSYHKISQQLIKQISISNIKVQLNKNIKENINGKLQSSNKEILQQLYKNLNKKITCIKNTIETQHQINRFLANLQLQQQQSKQKINLTLESNKLTQQEQVLFKNYQFQYKIYHQYFKNDPQIKKMLAVMDLLKNNHESNLNKVKNQIDQVKQQINNQVNALKQLQTMQKIRQAQLTQMQQILKQKKQQIDKFGLMPPSNQDAFDIFRSSKIGIKKSY